MSDAAADITPLDPVVRFRLRTILVATTALAIAVAIAAPYWRRQSEPVRWGLSAYWIGFLAFALLAAWINWRRAWRHLPESGPIALIVWLGSRTRLNILSHPVGIAAAIVLISFVLAAQSHVIVRQGNHGRGLSILFPAIQGLAHGFMLCGFLLVFLRRPVYLCENGLSGSIYAPWKYIRQAEWDACRPGVMKLRRLDGDIYLDVPNNMRTEVEGFVRGKTRFVDEAALPPV